MKDNKILIESLNKHLSNVNKQKINQIKNLCSRTNLGKAAFSNIFQPLEQGIEPEKYVFHLEKINRKSTYLEVIKAYLQDMIRVLKNLRKENPEYYEDLISDYGELNKDSVYDWYQDLVSDDGNPEPSSYWDDDELDTRLEDLLIERKGNTSYTAGFTVGQVRTCKTLVDLFWNRIDRMYQDNLIENILKQIYR